VEAELHQAVDGRFGQPVHDGACAIRTEVCPTEPLGCLAVFCIEFNEKEDDQMKSSRLALLLAITLATPLASPVHAAEASTPVAPIQAQATGTYLGVLLSPVPDALRAQLGNALPSGQGVLIRDVVDDSPAAKAGLKSYDILIGYDDQKLFSTEQLTGLVRADRPDRKVTLRIVRGGTVEDAQVTLGQTQAVAESAYPRKLKPMHGRQLRPNAPLAGADEESWEGFDSMSLKRLPDGSFKAAIQYLDKDGKLVKQEFTGTRDVIRQQIMEQTDLPTPERHQLLDALSARDVFFPPPGWFAPGFYMPDWFNWHPGF
jgi:membrane-associated protease RseP (regulator of RpoE activity)